MVSAKDDGKDLLMTGSPIDNFVYAVLNYSELLQEDATEKDNVTWGLVIHLLYAIIVDSLEADLIFWLPIKEHDDTYLSALDLLYPEALQELGIDDYVVIDGTDEQDADLCANMIRAKMNREDELDNTSDRSGPNGSRTKGIQFVVEGESPGQGLDADSERLPDNE